MLTSLFWPADTLIGKDNMLKYWRFDKTLYRYVAHAEIIV